MLKAVVLLATIMSCSAAHAQETVRVPLFHREHAIIPNTVHVAVGDGPSVPVLFDTGSSGLRILAQYVGPEIRRTMQRVHDTYGDGTVVEGTVGYVRIRFPDAERPLATAEVAIEVIDRVSCKEEHPHCPGLGRQGVGIMGVNYNPKGPIFNPLAQFAGALGAGFVVDVRDGQSPHVRVGLSTKDREEFRFAELAAGPRAETGQQGWNTGTLSACYSVDARPVGCQPVVFDTGGSSMHFTFDNAPDHLIKHGHLTSGHRVGMRVGNLIDLVETVGPEAPVRSSSEQRSNSGEAFFRHFAVAFDARQGRIGFLH